MSRTSSRPARLATAEFFEKLDRPAIVRAIAEAESKSLGQIRVHLHHGRCTEARAAAEKVFLRLGMEKTAGRTGCLIFIAPTDRAFAVIGDLGIHERVGDDFWRDARDAALRLFSEGRFSEGIVAAVSKIGEELARYFPGVAGGGEANELADDVTED